MPFTKGHKLSVGNRGGGRKGYEFEQTQFGRMSRFLDEYLTLLEKVMDGKSNKDDNQKLNVLQSPALKILDKLHATKKSEDITSDGKPLIVEISQTLADRYNLKPSNLT